MSVLNLPISKKDWLREVGETNGVSVPSRGPVVQKLVADAGPWKPIVQKIVELQDLGNDWDGLGAVAPSRELLASAIGLAYLLYEQGMDPPHCVIPSLEGSINLEWQDTDGTIAEVEIDRPFHAEVMVIEPAKAAKNWTLPTE